MDILKQLNKKYGDGSAVLLGRADTFSTEVIPTGSMELDSALGVGGIPRGRIVEFYGPPGSGKTTLSLHLVANAQACGEQAFFIDAEHALDPSYANAIGVDTDSMYLSQPDYGEQALSIALDVISSGEFAIVVIDSVAALTPKAEIDADMEKMQVGLQARMMSKALRKLASITYKTDTTLLFVNQTRTKIGVTWGSPVTTPGGNALKFYSSVRLDIRRIGALKAGSEIVGNRTLVKVVKNKVAPPFKEAEFDIIYGKGISRASSVLDTAIQAGVVTKAGSWFSFEGDKIGQGRLRVIDSLSNDPALLKKIEMALSK